MSSILRLMTQSDLELVLSWRNHPDIRRFMYKQHEITSLEHFRWFESCQANAGRSLLIFEHDSVPTGFVNITQSTLGHIADWGFYLSPDAMRGSGTLLGEAALKYAFQTLGLHKVCGQALAYNERSIRFHLRLGFTREGELRDQHFEGKQYHSIIHFGLLEHEWQANKRGVQA